MPQLDPRACQTCHRDYPPARPNQKYCPPCRLLMDLGYWNEEFTKPTACRVCARPYLRTSRKAELCAHCDASHRRGTCVVCLQDDRDLHRHGAPVCLWCLKDPRVGVRTSVIRELRRHVGTDAPATETEHPDVVAVRATARLVADRLRCSDAEALARGKAALGLAADEQTTDLPALRAALEGLA